MKKKPGFFLLLALPAFLLWFVFMLGPALRGVQMSFTNEALVGKAAANPQFVGFENYRRLFADELFFNSIKNSFLFVMGAAIVGQSGLGLLLAVLTSSRRRFWPQMALTGRLATTAAFLAWVAPETVIGFSWISYLDIDGVLNQIVTGFGVTSVWWMVRFPLLSVIIANVWAGTGWSLMLYRSALESIPPEIEEAAEVDGASGWQRFRLITLPMIRGPIQVNLILITIWTYGVFGLPLMLTGGGPAHRSELMTIYAYKQAFKFFELGYGTTVSVGILLITGALALVYYRLLGRE